MRLQAVEGLPLLHVTPLAETRVAEGRVIVELDDHREVRRKLLFQPYQAVRVVTEDCFELPGELSVIQQTVGELVPSPWIEELRRTLAHKDETATFLDRARHFLIPAQDDFIEVVAWSVTCE